MVAMTTLTAMLLATAAPASAPAPIVAEAEGFMANYADELRAGDRDGVAALYHPEGALLVRGSDKLLLSPEQLLARYRRPQWIKPAAFGWSDLTYVPAGDQAVAVVGYFDWQDSAGPPKRGVYHALLVRDAGGRLRIRIEDERAR